jgi:hypothetical protein
MTYGPIDFIALEFPGNQFTGKILPDLFELVDKGIIRIIDLVIIRKEQGQVSVRELPLFVLALAGLGGMSVTAGLALTRQRR